MPFISSRVFASAAAFALFGLCHAGSAQSQTFTWNFNNTLPANTTSHGYLDTTNAYTLIAYGETTANTPGTVTNGNTWNTGTVTPHALFGKTSGDLSETGLGLTGGSDSEIGPNAFVQLDVTDLKNHHLNNLNMFVSSIQKGEGFYLWGSNTQGTPGTLLKSFVNSTGAAGADTNSFLVPNIGDYNFFAISATGGDVLLRNGLTASATPEPGSLALLATSGLSGAGFLIRKRRCK